MKKTVLIVLGAFVGLALLVGACSGDAKDDSTPSSSMVTSSFDSHNDSSTDKSSSTNSSSTETSSTYTSSDTTSQQTQVSSSQDSAPETSSSAPAVSDSEPTSSIVSSQPTNNTDSTTVYITETGKKYHSRKSCSGLSRAKDIYETTLSSARQSGLGPCSKCY